MHKYVIVVAAGQGTRAASPIAKQFINIHSKPLLWHTLQHLNAAGLDLNFIVVVPHQYMPIPEPLQSAFSFPIQWVKGGSNRALSVQLGLKFIKHRASLIMIHDAVRPFVSPLFIERCFNKAAQFDSAIPYVSIEDSMRKEGKEKNYISVARKEYIRIQTPQTFKYDLIMQAYRQDNLSCFTDDASLVESTGKTLHYISGERNNFKITYPEDIQMAEALLKKPK